MSTAGLGPSAFRISLPEKTNTLERTVSLCIGGPVNEARAGGWYGRGKPGPAGRLTPAGEGFKKPARGPLRASNASRLFLKLRFG